VAKRHTPLAFLVVAYERELLDEAGSLQQPAFRDEIGSGRGRPNGWRQPRLDGRAPARREGADVMPARKMRLIQPSAARLVVPLWLQGQSQWWQRVYIGFKQPTGDTSIAGYRIELPFETVKIRIHRRCIGLATSPIDMGIALEADREATLHSCSTLSTALEWFQTFCDAGCWTWQMRTTKSTDKGIWKCFLLTRWALQHFCSFLW
jgi:hypothetical protein